MKSAGIIKIIVAIVAFLGVGTAVIFLPIYGENDTSLIRYFEEKRETTSPSYTENTTIYGYYSLVDGAEGAGLILYEDGVMDVFLGGPIDDAGRGSYTIEGDKIKLAIEGGIIKGTIEGGTISIAGDGFSAAFKKESSYSVSNVKNLSGDYSIGTYGAKIISIDSKGTVTFMGGYASGVRAICNAQQLIITWPAPEYGEDYIKLLQFDIDSEMLVWNLATSDIHIPIF
ncbi:MAG: hypothetical protein LBQ80_04740 [Clostridium sp.]|jgi:hypothetical protein|nr:hypothetical protein [Clostridium sp.]